MKLMKYFTQMILNILILKAISITKIKKTQNTG